MPNYEKQTQQREFVLKMSIFQALISNQWANEIQIMGKIAKSQRLRQQQLEQLAADAISSSDLWFFCHRCNANYIIKKINNLLTPCGASKHSSSAM